MGVKRAEGNAPISAAPSKIQVAEKVSTIRGKLRKNLYRRKKLHYLNTRSRAPPNGGFLLIVTGCRIAKMQDFPVADMIPATVLVMPLSALWTNYIAPLL